MNTRAKVIVGFLVVAVVGLAVAVGVMAADDDDHDNGATTHMDTGSGYADMMRSMANMDSSDMLVHMREVLGPDGYNRMREHMEAHRTGGATMGDSDIDAMMHDMMDGMMKHMPIDGGTLIPPGNDEHHETPRPSRTPA